MKEGSRQFFTRLILLHPFCASLEAPHRTEDHILTRTGQVSSALAAYRSLSVDLLLLSSASLRALDVRFPILTNAFLSYQCMPQMPYHMGKGPQTPRKLPPFYALDADLPILLAVSLLSSFASRQGFLF